MWIALRRWLGLRLKVEHTGYCIGWQQYHMDERLHMVHMLSHNGAT